MHGQAVVRISSVQLICSVRAVTNAPFTRGSIHEAHIKHTYSIYTVIKSALRVHDGVL